MKKVQFYKLQASGNDFILIDRRKFDKEAKINYKKFAQKFCARKFGVGADGLLVIESSKKYDFKMRIFNADGSEPEMCGNGARCVAFWANRNLKGLAKVIKFDTKAGLIEAAVKGKKSDSKCGEVAIKMVEPQGLRLDLMIRILGRTVKANFINTGVPHTIIFVEGIENIDINKIGREIRFHKRFSPAGTNVNFVEISNDGFIKVRTYERGVEAETLACGTGVTASAIISKYKLHPSGEKKHKVTDYKMRVLTKSSDVLRVYFKRRGDNIGDVWLEGAAHFVCKGELA
jgi:diaminopimelate epimerase